MARLSDERRAGGNLRFPHPSWVRFAAGMRKPLLVATVTALATGVAAGCGAEDHANEPRPASPIEVTAKVDEERIDVSPDEFGAGLVVMTISNQSEDPVQIGVEGPTAGESSGIEPGSVGSFKFNFEQGDYEVSPGEDSGARPALLTVGPQRASSQNELLLP